MEEFKMKKALTFVLVLMMAVAAFSASAMAGTSGSIPIGLKLFGFKAGDFVENGEGEYVGTLELTGYRVGYQYNKKQAGIANDTGDVKFLEFNEFAVAHSWSTYYTSTQKVAIKQTYEEQNVTFVYSGPVNKGVRTTVTVEVPALPAEPEPLSRSVRAFAQADPIISGFSIGGLTPPVAGAAPLTLGGLSTNGDARFSVTGLRWYPAVSAFAEGETYYALVTVEANEGYIFDGNYGALELMTGGRLSNIDVGFDAIVNLNEMYDFDQVPFVKKFTFQVTCPVHP
jgi:hypothetical protein